jgi:hypothetical protein
MLNELVIAETRKMMDAKYKGEANKCRCSSIYWLRRIHQLFITYAGIIAIGQAIGVAPRFNGSAGLKMVRHPSTIPGNGGGSHEILGRTVG